MGGQTDATCYLALTCSFCWMFDATLLDGVVTLKTGWPNERNIGCNNVGSNVASNVTFTFKIAPIKTFRSLLT